MNATHVYLITLVGVLIAPPSIAGQTPILNSDLPGGSGDWETTGNNLALECEITTGKHKGVYRSDDPDLNLPEGFLCEPAVGSCSNKRIVPENSCPNLKVRWHWTGGNTPWFDRDLPTGGADYESIELQLKIECLVGTKTYFPGDELPAGYTCHSFKGAWCDNSKTQPLNNCKHVPVSVRYSW